MNFIVVAKTFDWAGAQRPDILIVCLASLKGAEDAQSYREGPKCQNRHSI